MNLVKLFSILLLLIGLSTGVLAQETPESYVPVRSNGMGGAFTAISNDENAVWTNPAGIARIRKARSRSTVNLFKFPNISAGANGSSREFLSGISESGNAENAQSLSDEASSLSRNPLWSMLSLFPMIMLDVGALPSIMGAYSHTRLKAIIDEDDNTLARAEAISDVGGVFGASITTRTNRVNFGFNLRYLSRFAYEETLTLADLQNPNTLQTRIKENSNKSTALAVDLGFLWTFADFWFPTIGIAMFNAPTGCQDNYLNPFSKTRQKICGTVFTGDIANPDALSTVDPTDLRVGISITPRFSRKLAARIAIDMHHLHFASGEQNFGLEDVPFRKQIHAGAEFFSGNPLLPAPFSVAVGVNQGFYSMGFTIRTSFFSLEFTSYGKNVSTTDTPLEDRRYLAAISFGG
ncbi:MAG: hypothetical protein HRU19_11055 [Pseudobacteriovorax sp.]|nr:hypothetical protein [Pseudobacteriovorax sp.]